MSQLWVAHSTGLQILLSLRVTRWRGPSTTTTTPIIAATATTTTAATASICNDTAAAT
eukprot:CAMPEP_0175881944 /NCGR_PEP_ID=MMETSP0107_2-20121207/43143_1 /TAXON_ID=195067 ORGANISM="Goniomonas pacifica, Strain CCMP1869" /NCGR_SAMPLE_ID=MMETSP0107_2 /ASSEMBLY_ACC=CAM_ASM_000203 /LENGTH=57 /DNA_ID=CAMNT_0017201833 /DNA_START=21 /DNA_END=191 /DNA_ORIENTATION=+